MRKQTTRRKFLQATCAGTVIAGVSGTANRAPAAPMTGASDKLALLGGAPVRSAPFPAWPVIGQIEEEKLLAALRSKRWNRLGGSFVEQFEKTWAERLGAPHCLATASGTSALTCALNALEVGPGDEVIVPPYTFVATINVVLLQHALPIFVDTDRQTFQIDAHKIEAAITKQTRALLPVHLGGAAANLDVILSFAQKHKLPVVEDACQSHLAEWRGRKVGTLGTLGCFSLQASKNLNAGEGGAIMSSDAQLIEVCRSFHNQGRGAVDAGFGYVRNGDNRRMTEFQGALLLAQLTRLEEQARRREQNAAYLIKLLNDIPGLAPARLHDGCTRNAYHLFMFRYDAAQFSNLPRERFLKALRAEGVPASGGYAPLNKEPFLARTLASRAYRRVYSARELKQWAERNHCPENDRLCQEAVWLTQNMLLGERQDMEQIAAAISKIQKQAATLARA